MSCDKKCDVCGKKLPCDYGNLLCDEHYATHLKDVERQKKDAKEEQARVLAQQPVSKLEREEIRESEELKRLKSKATQVKEDGEKQLKFKNLEHKEPIVDPKEGKADESITAPDYQENHEQPDKHQVLSNLKQFMEAGDLLYYQTKQMYTNIKNYMIEKTQAHSQFSKHIWKPHVVDVGCGAGIGTNILSWEADFAWGIDKNEYSIHFAQQAFTREKNAIYYTPQVSFDVVDIMTEDRELMRFDIVVAIEIIEHVDDYKTFLKQLIHRFAKRDKSGKLKNELYVEKNGEFFDGTEYFISTPNRNYSRIGQKRPTNLYHVREWTSQEFLNVLSQYFEEVKLYTWEGFDAKPDTDTSPIYARCRKPKI